MLIAAILLIVAGALVLAFVHPPDRDARRLRNFGAGALIVAGVIVLVLYVLGAFDAEVDTEAALAFIGARRARARARDWARHRAGLDVDRRNLHTLTEVAPGVWEPATPLPDPKAWALWRFLGLMPRPVPRMPCE